jgi:hypothetical protein
VEPVYRSPPLSPLPGPETVRFTCIPAFLIGLAVPIAARVLGALPGLQRVHDGVVLPLVYRVLLPWRGPILALLLAAALWRQQRSRATHVALYSSLGVLLGVLLAFDCWYHVPFTLAAVLALAIWRLRWILWDSCRLVTGVTVGLTAVVVGSLCLDRLGWWCVLDNRFGLGLPATPNRVGMGFLLTLLAGVAIAWAIRHVGSAELAPDFPRGRHFYRSLLADLITRDLRCVEYFRLLRRSVRCALPGADKPSTPDVRLRLCATFDQDARRERGVLTSRGALGGSLPRRFAGAVSRAFLAATQAFRPVDRDSMGKSVKAGELPPVFPDVKFVPPVMETGWTLARLWLSFPPLAALTRWRQRPLHTPGIPSDLLRAMVEEALKRSYGAYWLAVHEEHDWETAERHFARVVALHEAAIEARCYVFFQPRVVYTPAQAPAMVAALAEQVARSLSAAGQSPANGDASGGTHALDEAARVRRQVWQRVHEYYADLWQENLDRMALRWGERLFGETMPPEALRSPVDFAQLTCNLLACRAQMRSPDASGSASVHAAAADLALWILVRLASGAERGADVRAQELLLDQYLNGVTTLVEGPAGLRRRARVAAPEPGSEDEGHSFMFAMAYALWRGMGGRWDLAPKPLVCFEGLDAAFAARSPRARRLRAVKAHVDSILALKGLTDGEADEAEGDEFGRHARLKWALDAYADLSRYPWTDSDFLAWYPDKWWSLTQRVAERALTRLEPAAPVAEAPVPADSKNAGSQT